MTDWLDQIQWNEQGLLPAINIVLNFTGFVPVSWVIWLACYEGDDKDSGIQRMER